MTAFDLDPRVGSAAGSAWDRYLHAGTVAGPDMSPLITESNTCSATGDFGCNQSWCHCETAQACGPTYACTTQTCDGTTGTPCAC